MLGLGLLHLIGEGRRLVEQGIPVRPGDLRDAAGQGALLGAQPVGVGDDRPTALVGGQQVVHECRILATGELRPADSIGIVADESEVDHECPA